MGRYILDMDGKPSAIFCWSGGKDSAMCLHKVMTEGTYDVKYLLTTVNDTFRRISMHGVREELLNQQVAAIGLPLLTVRVAEGTNSEYEQQMAVVLTQAKAEGIEHVIFGDIFLEDLRLYREENLARVGMTAVFPLWQQDTSMLVKQFIRDGFRTVLCCTNDAHLGLEWAGREIDGNFLSDLPANVDPCGENGEYHTFCFAGPVFKHEIPFVRGEKVYRPLDIKLQDATADSPQVTTRGFWFCDLLLPDSPEAHKE